MDDGPSSSWWVCRTLQNKQRYAGWYNFPPDPMVVSDRHLHSVIKNKSQLIFELPSRVPLTPWSNPLLKSSYLPWRQAWNTNPSPRPTGKTRAQSRPKFPAQNTRTHRVSPMPAPPVQTLGLWSLSEPYHLSENDGQPLQSQQRHLPVTDLQKHTLNTPLQTSNEGKGLSTSSTLWQKDFWLDFMCHWF